MAKPMVEGGYDPFVIEGHCVDAFVELLLRIRRQLSNPEGKPCTNWNDWCDALAEVGKVSLSPQLMAKLAPTYDRKRMPAPEAIEGIHYAQCFYFENGDLVTAAALWEVWRCERTIDGDLVEG